MEEQNKTLASVKTAFACCDEADWRGARMWLEDAMERAQTLQSLPLVAWLEEERRGLERAVEGIDPEDRDSVF